MKLFILIAVLLLGTSFGDTFDDHDDAFPRDIQYLTRLPVLASLLISNCSVDNQPIEVWEHRFVGKKILLRNDPHKPYASWWVLDVGDGPSCVCTPHFRH